MALREVWMDAKAWSWSVEHRYVHSVFEQNYFGFWNLWQNWLFANSDLKLRCKFSQPKHTVRVEKVLEDLLSIFGSTFEFVFRRRKTLPVWFTPKNNVSDKYIDWNLPLKGGATISARLSSICLGKWIKVCFSFNEIHSMIWPFNYDRIRTIMSDRSEIAKLNCRNQRPKVNRTSLGQLISDLPFSQPSCLCLSQTAKTCFNQKRKRDWSLTAEEQEANKST